VASGYYDYSDKLVKLVLAIVTATGTVMLPHIANLYANKKFAQVKTYLYISCDFVLFISVPMMFGIASIATALAPWFFGSQFASVNILLIIEAPVIVLIGISNVIGQQFLLPTKHTKTYTASVVLGAVTNIVVNIPLILKFGVKGAMIATVLSEVAVTTYQLVKVRNILLIRKLFKSLWKYFVGGIVMFVPVYILNIQMSISILSLVLQIIVGLLFYVGTMCILQPELLNNVKSLKKRFDN